MHLTQVHTISCVLRFYVSVLNSQSRQRINRCCLLNNPIKKLTSRPRSPAVKPEGKLIQVVIQVRYTHGSLMRSQQPTFEKRNNSVYQWQQIFTDVGLLTNDVVVISQALQLAVATPAIRSHHSGWLDTILDRSFQTLCRGIEYSVEADSPDAVPVLLGYDKHQCLAHRTTATFPWLLSTKVRFIDFYHARETVSPRPYHGGAQFVQPRPRGSVTTKAQGPLQAKRADSVFLVRYVPHCPEPQQQRFARILEDSARCDRSLEMTVRAMVQSSLSLPRVLVLATGAAKTIRPSKLKKIVSTRLIGAKSLFKFHQCSRVVFHARLYYMLGLLESSA
jgi:hypothetical protein